MVIEILGYPIYSGYKKEILNDIEEIVSSEGCVHIVSGNPEVLYQGLFEKPLYENFTSKRSLIIPDGVGVIFSAKVKGLKVKEKIAGIEVMQDIISYCNRKNKSIYLLGSKDSIVRKCKINIEATYKDINVVGYKDGYFDLDNCDDIIEDINKCNPDVLFVAMGCPRQERFIIKHMDKLHCKLFMGVGGSFDILAGELKRAPKWMITFGIEWLYRILKEPFRIKRMKSIPKFMIRAIIGKV
ncbi:WecB/TagA/CpsF family glycosyltransferase [Clostridium algidicarnis]|uniref:N-acetylglucosaminyldiphosphoundecaprenol N-acetyl-beta-D-mannosaminyltransferase n=1 Tax=Clostridium algidicarnis TaxID=37659 RepID=A0ABS6C345_9CLOT|nr:WecB/TagA/CpsF family glycosyltransferase [Clostridium algidicarnis]MBB6631225.1 WecB/TagA/CpsF family glycosyltransferase [Clostridium algidicarnis]MBU3193863.1 WecB/TagA/CpsF family glycosyltransferase [Clostridium algidicarnis]MBU3203257.1 WecB/TagA/CpsF family glycosyltransferase [Clostridium algidicarnis]MBU3205449.1 WecB/TagA/CpsF family glycosyltransferase [Clostridium algidicarnis]MBU3211411.1 WecB/TagA/CpsF family glycosyltransferase [Clostridium algidicarnis]